MANPMDDEPTKHDAKEHASLSPEHVQDVALLWGAVDETLAP